MVFIISSMFIFLGFSQTVTWTINYKHKVYSTRPDEDKTFKTQYYKIRKMYDYTKRFYSINKLPIIYLFWI